MLDFVNYLKDHPEIIISSLTFVFTIIVLIVKRKPKTLDDFISIVDESLSHVPSWVADVETPGNGAVKKSAVIKCAEQYVQSKLHRWLSPQEVNIIDVRTSKMIEDVLSTPTKKEIKNV